MNPPVETTCESCAMERANMDIVEGVCESCNFQCTTCPCRWVSFAPQLFEYVEQTYGHDNIDYPDGRNGAEATVSTAEVRYALYRQVTRITYGYLGRGVRRLLPPCVHNGIKEEYPDEEPDETSSEDKNDE